MIAWLICFFSHRWERLKFYGGYDWWCYDCKEWR